MTQLQEQDTNTVYIRIFYNGIKNSHDNGYGGGCGYGDGSGRGYGYVYGWGCGDGYGWGKGEGLYLKGTRI